MQYRRTTAPGATVTTAVTAAALAAPARPRSAAPMDGTAGGAPAGDGGGGAAGTATLAPPAPAAVDPGQAPAPAAPVGQPAPTPAAPPAMPDQLFSPPTPAAAPAVPPAPTTGQPAGSPAPAGPIDDRPLDQFPEDIRSYIEKLRRENGDNRVKAKTAEQAAEDQKREWLANLTKAFGLPGSEPEAPPVDPAQQAQQLTDELAAARDEHRAARVELALWKGAQAHGADAERLSDSRRFMTAVGALDPTAADFEARLAAAIGAAVESDPTLQAAGQAPAAAPPPPPVPSGGEFAGGPSGDRTGPQSVDDFRAELRKHRPR